MALITEEPLYTITNLRRHLQLQINTSKRKARRQIDRAYFMHMSSSTSALYVPSLELRPSCAQICRGPPLRPSINSWPIHQTEPASGPCCAVFGPRLHSSLKLRCPLVHLHPIDASCLHVPDANLNGRKRWPNRLEGRNANHSPAQRSERDVRRGRSDGFLTHCV